MNDCEEEHWVAAVKGTWGIRESKIQTMGQETQNSEKQLRRQIKMVTAGKEKSNYQKHNTNPQIQV